VTPKGPVKRMILPEGPPGRRGAGSALASQGGCKRDRRHGSAAVEHAQQVLAPVDLFLKLGSTSFGQSLPSVTMRRGMEWANSM
jgi:hypothetical protein